MPAIDINSISFSYTDRPLLDGISLYVGDGERACLIGPNGCGKSTLLGVIAGDIRPDSGTVSIPGATKAGLRVPSVTGEGSSVQDYIDAALTHFRELSARFDHVTEALSSEPFSSQLAAEYDSLLAAMTTADVWSLDARINETLAGLGLSQLAGEGRMRPVRTLSPGQAGRLELAAMMLARPVVLLLDEPTNHLDDEAAQFLTRQICQWPGPVLMTSHDRAFIEAVATVMYDFDTAPWQAMVTAAGGGRLPGVYRCSGTYTDYLQAKQHAKVAHRELHSAQQAEKRSVRLHRRASEDIASGGKQLANASGMARKFFSDRAAATAVGRTRHDDRRLEALAEREVRKPRNYELSLNLQPIRVRSGLAISARAVRVLGRLDEVTFDLATGEHLLVTGGNGSGKSTLLTWIAAGRPPRDAEGSASGSVSVGGTLACIPQRLPRCGDAGFSRDVWDRGIGETGAGVLHPSMWATPIAKLSAGNQRRAQIGVAVEGRPEIVVIDEPTNYLDLASIEALESALASWNGTLIIASHDRWLIDHWRGRRLHLTVST
ncbi:ABC-F family ATP-binding cassette domain-containing protein [Devriesea agamarum]|uniref:ABC-F family ATP-binding cassette domain-containing protein n=1 Tax=Devriesea agamarum TaxID=472569 RepID=UPI00071DE012|nr:ATP-binding cassette domain-containing protein [Devriesea agamarum]